MTEDYRYTIQKHVAITAGAGTGKTYTLSRRYINALLGFDFFTLDAKSKFDIDFIDSEIKSAKPTQIVTTTFTEAGAMEMRSRIEWLVALMLKILQNPSLTLKNSEENGIKKLIFCLDTEQKLYVEKKLKDASSSIYLSIISTIHKFAISIISKNSDLVPMDTTIDVIDDTLKNELFEKLWLKVANSREELFLQIDNDFKINTAKSFAKNYLFDRRVRDGFDTFVANNDTAVLKQVYLQLFFRNNIDKIIKAFEKYDISQKKKRSYEDIFSMFLGNIFKFDSTTIVELAGEKKASAPYTDINNIFKPLSTFKKEGEFLELIKKIHIILQELRDSYLSKLKNDGKLDFDRILEVANNLLDDKRASINKYKYFFVDEFQDTNLFQWSIVKKAASLEDEDCANIFLVGDEKQSIFEFQGAEVSTFRSAIDEIIKLKGSGSIVQPKMSLNFRSDENIIRFVNNTFKDIMSSDTTVIKQPNFETAFLNSFLDEVYRDFLDGGDTLHKECEVDYDSLEANSKEKGTLKLLVKKTRLSQDAKDSPDIKKLDGYTTKCRAQHEAYMLADFIQNIKEARVDEYLDISKKLQENDKAIAILYNAKSNMLVLKDALKRLGIDAKVSASEDFYKSDEIVEIYNILAVVSLLKEDGNFYIEQNPNNDLEIAIKNNKSKADRFILASAMRSKVFRYTDRDILEHIDANKIPKNIKKLISLGHILTLGELVDHIVEDYELKRVYAHLEDYPQKKANLTKISKAAYEFQATYETPLKEFVDMLQGAVLGDDVAKEDQAFYESEQTKSIEIRTMHSSKGLSWPMVIVPELGRDISGMTSNALKFARYNTQDETISIVGFKVDGEATIASSTASLISEKKHYAEKKRLLYVAMTRAQNHLVLSVASDSKELFDKKSFFAKYLNLSVEPNDSVVTTKIVENDMLDCIHKFTSEDNISVEVYEKTLKGMDSEPICDVEEFELSEHLLDIRDENIGSNIYDDENIKIDNPFKYSKAARFGTAVHKLLEVAFHEKIFNTQEEESYIEEFIKSEDIEDTLRVFKIVKNFKESEVFKDLQDSEQVLFEEEFNFFDKKLNMPQKRFIDLIYFKDDKFNIIDFKSNILKHSKDEIIKEHEYDVQLGGYYDFVASRFGKENINLCSILWLDDGTLSDLKPQREGK
ncbi:MAG: UvrD-helicase domain-containing protein [Sulfurimonas sp.]|nr:UvrD-helicase domain-containing protein [Sulfurimonas sp.]